MTAQNTPAAFKAQPAPQDAVTLLKADHDLMNQLFAEYETASSVANKQTLVAEICIALSVHTQIEEEIFYPAVQSVLINPQLVSQAYVELADVKNLVAELESTEPDAEVYDVKVRVLSEHVRHHVHVEQNQMFPRAKASSLDMVALGMQMDARMQTLMSLAA